MYQSILRTTERMYRDSRSSRFWTNLESQRHIRLSWLYVWLLLLLVVRCWTLCLSIRVWWEFPPSKMTEKAFLRRELNYICPPTLLIALHPVVRPSFFFFLHVGSLISPCLSSLVSQFGQHNKQGAILGLNQLFGALARAAAPMVSTNRANVYT